MNGVIHSPLSKAAVWSQRFSDLLSSTDTTPKEESKQDFVVGELSKLWKGFFVFIGYIRSQRKQCFDFDTSSNLHTLDIFVMSR